MFSSTKDQKMFFFFQYLASIYCYFFEESWLVLNHCSSILFARFRGFLFKLILSTLYFRRSPEIGRSYQCNVFWPPKSYYECMYDCTDRCFFIHMLGQCWRIRVHLLLWRELIDAVTFGSLDLTFKWIVMAEPIAVSTQFHIKFVKSVHKKTEKQFSLSILIFHIIEKVCHPMILSVACFCLAWGISSFTCWAVDMIISCVFGFFFFSLCIYLFVNGFCV